MDIVQDLKYASRSLRRNPGLTAVAVASIALGIGANTALFSIIQGVLLRSLPYPDAGRLFVIRERVATKTKQYPSAAANVRHYLEWREQCPAFERLGAAYSTAMNLTGVGEPERVGTMRVSANFFEVLGVPVRVGRTFRLEEEQPGRDRVVVITDGLWRRRFGADPGMVGRSIDLDGAAHTVVGILPESFRLPRSEHLGGAVRHGVRNELFKPFGLDMSKQGPLGEHDYLVVGRLAVGADPRQALAQVEAVQQRISERFGRVVDLGAVLVPMQEHVTGNFRRGLWILMAAAFAVLMTVCANLANLMLARALARSREIAIRTAIGAGAWPILRLMLAEAALVAAAGGVLGVLLASWGIDLFVASAPESLPRVEEVRFDRTVLAFASGLSLLAMLLFSVAPALHALRSDPQDALRSGPHTASEGRRGRRTRNLLVASEVALSTVLLIAAGLLTASLMRLVTVDKGFSTDHVLAAEVEMRKSEKPEQREARIRSLEARVRALPGVESVSVSTVLPLEGSAHVSFVKAEGDPRNGFDLPMANYRYVSPGFQETLRIPLKRGRWFTESDRNRPVVVINERTAQTVFPGQDPIGKRMQPGGGLAYAEVIGIVADTRLIRLHEEPVLMAYLPWWVRNPASFSLLVRSGGDPALLAEAIRREVAAVDSAAVVARTRTLDRVLEDSVSVRRYQLWLLGAFAAAALAVASLGIYGVVSYSVARRRSELGIRLALGAAASDLRLLVLRQGMTPVLAGIGGGIVAAAALSRFLNSLLFGVAALDPATYAAVAAVLLAVALLACALPANRAVKSDPVSALRYE